MHLIFSTKYRRNILCGDALKDKIKDISLNSCFNIEQIEVDKDHIHVLISHE